jgi:hypothetical protein
MSISVSTSGRATKDPSTTTTEAEPTATSSQPVVRAADLLMLDAKPAE